MRLTKEYDLNGMCLILQDMMEDFYPGFEILVFLLTPGRDNFYFPRPEKEHIREICYDRAIRKIKNLKLEYDLLQFLAGKRFPALALGWVGISSILILNIESFAQPPFLLNSAGKRSTTVIAGLFLNRNINSLSSAAGILLH